MTKKGFFTKADEIQDFKDKLGEMVLDAVMEDDNSCYEMAKGIFGTFENCQTDREFEIAEQMLIAICGYSLESLVEKIQERDREGYVWYTTC